MLSSTSPTTVSVLSDFSLHVLLSKPVTESEQADLETLWK